jgi:hypothetical protein
VNPPPPSSLAPDGAPPCCGDDLAMVSEVRSAPLAFRRLNRQHLVPLDSGLLELLDHVAMAGNAGGADVIKQQPYLHAASSYLGQSLKEIIRR